MERQNERTPLITINDLALQLNISPKTIRNLRVHGIGPKAIKIGGSLRWQQETVDKYLEDLESGVETMEAPERSGCAASDKRLRYHSPAARFGGRPRRGRS